MRGHDAVDPVGVQAHALAPGLVLQIARRVRATTQPADRLLLPLARQVELHAGLFQIAHAHLVDGVERGGHDAIDRGADEGAGRLVDHRGRDGLRDAVLGLGVQERADIRVHPPEEVAAGFQIPRHLRGAGGFEVVDHPVVAIARGLFGPGRGQLGGPREVAGRDPLIELLREVAVAALAAAPHHRRAQPEREAPDWSRGSDHGRSSSSQKDAASGERSRDSSDEVSMVRRLAARNWATPRAMASWFSRSVSPSLRKLSNWAC